MTHTTTDFGSFYNFTGSATVGHVVADYLGGGDSDWRERMEAAGAVDAIEADFRSAIDDLLPEGLWLTGDQFIGYIDVQVDRDEIRDAIEEIDLGAIVDRHDVDNAQR